MAEKKLVPELRFPGFEGEWESTTLGDIGSFSKGRGISKADIDPEGVLECIRYGELYTTYSEVIDDVKSRTSVDTQELVLSQGNDVIIPASGESQIDIATASCVLKDGVALGGDLNIIRTSLNGIFLAYYLNNKKKQEIASLAQGISVIHLYSNQLKTLLINVPSTEEQRKIAFFLTTIDEHIQLLEKKKKSLERYKKGVMQKIFSQEVRFKDDDGKDFPDWEKKKIIEIAPLQRGFDLPNSEISEGPYPVVFSNGILKYHNVYKIQGPGVVTGRSGTIGKVTFVKGNYWPHNTSLWVTNFFINDPKFIYYFYLNVKLDRYNAGSTVPTLNRNDVHSLKKSIPSLLEQQKIASFLSAFDNSIDQVDRQLIRVKEYKKGLLQKIFV